MRTLVTGFIAVIVTMTINSFVLLFAIDNLADEVREANKANEQVVMAYEEEPVVAAYEEPEEEIVPVYYEKEASGAMFYTFGDLIMDKYAFGIMIHKGQGIYTYYDYNDHRIECKSLSELQEVIMCHIDQAWPNARFVMFFIR
jgi:hypothetical protein